MYQNSKIREQSAPLLFSQPRNQNQSLFNTDPTTVLMDAAATADMARDLALSASMTGKVRRV